MQYGKELVLKFFTSLLVHACHLPTLNKFHTSLFYTHPKPEALQSIFNNHKNKVK
jgi:hypothetical protein